MSYAILLLGIAIGWTAGYLDERRNRKRECKQGFTKLGDEIYTIEKCHNRYSGCEYSRKMKAAKDGDMVSIETKCLDCRRLTRNMQLKGV